MRSLTSLLLLLGSSRALPVRSLPSSPGARGPRAAPSPAAPAPSPAAPLPAPTGPRAPSPRIPNSTLKLSSAPPNLSSAPPKHPLSSLSQTFLRFSLPPRSLSEPSLPLQKLQKHSQGLAAKHLPFRALPPKFHSNSPHLNSTLSPAFPGVRPPVLPGRSWVPRSLGGAGHSLRGPSSPLSRQPTPASRAVLSPPPSGPLTSAAPARAPARGGLRRSAPGCRRLLRLPGTDNEGQACRVTSAPRKAGPAARGGAESYAPPPPPFFFRLPGLGFRQVFIARLAGCPGPVVGAVGNQNGRQDILLSRGAFSGGL